MKNEIINNIDNPDILEKLYRSDKSGFKSGFIEIYPEIKEHPSVVFWIARLKDDDALAGAGEAQSLPLGNFGEKRSRLIFTIAAIFICGSIFKIPQLFGLNIQSFIVSNFASVLFPALAVYYLFKNNAGIKKYIIILTCAAFTALFMNLVPWSDHGDTKYLSFAHFSFITWVLLGAAYTNFDIWSPAARIQYLKRNGDMIILTGVLMCAGMVLIMLTVSMFSVIKVKIDYILENYVVVYGLVTAPFAANYMIESSPRIINRVAPFISKLFTPLMLVAMTGFLIALIFFAQDPFNNRGELIVFNILLAAIIAVIIFSFSTGSSGSKSIYNRILLALSIEGLIVNAIALSAIIYRLALFGVSPNRIAVLGANILLAANLVIITLKLFKFNLNKASEETVEAGITAMLPYYAVWAGLIAIVLPFIFWFK